MIIGQTIAAENATGTAVYTPWFPRQGNNCTSAIEVIALAGQGTLAAVMESKNSNQTDGSAAPIGSKTGITSGDDTYTFDCTDAMELVRCEITLTSGNSTVVYAHFRMLSPSWETTGAQGV